MYVADSDDNRIRKVDTSDINYDLAGTATLALLTVVIPG
jgi:hypothetical protein